MSSKAVTEQPQGTEPTPKRPQGWDAAPSVVRDDNPSFARYVGFFGAFLVVFAGIFLVMHYWFHRASAIGPGWLTFFLAIGIMGMLFHAAFDRDLQFRRVYMAFSYAAMIIGVFLCGIPWPDRMGDQFQAGYLCLSLALFFLLAFLRNETDESVRVMAQRVLGGVGGLMLITGLVGGNIKSQFLLPIGIELTLLGFVYLAAFVSARGIADDQAYYSGIGIGVASGLAFLIAFARSFVFKQPGVDYFLPNGLTLMLLGFIGVLLSLMLCSDARLVVLTRRELGSFFYSPIAYFVLLAFTLIEGWIYGGWIISILNSEEAIPEPVIASYLLQWQSVVLMIAVIPALTMRLFSEERRTGTLEVMLTTPVNEVSVVLSKFFSAFLMYLLVWAPMYLLMVAMRAMTGQPFDYYPALSFAIVVATAGAGFIGMGVFFSSLTRNQLVAGVMTGAGMIVLTFVYMLKFILMPRGERVPTKGWPLFLQHIGYIDMWINAITGMVEIKYMIFYLSLCVFFLFLSVKVLEARKWL